MAPCILMQSVAVLLPDFTTDGPPVEKSGCSLLHRTQSCHAHQNKKTKAAALKTAALRLNLISALGGSGDFPAGNARRASAGAVARLRGSFSLRLAFWRALRGGHFLSGIVQPTLEVIIRETVVHLHRKKRADLGIALINI